VLEQAATTTTKYATKVYLINIMFAILKTFSSICLLTLILISLVSITSILLQQHYAAAEGLLQKTHVTLVHANTNNILTNNKNNSTINIKLQKSSLATQKEEQNTAVKSFQEAFCGTNSSTTTSNSNRYVTEHTLPQNCEMPLGIAVDSNAHRVWYVSTKKGVLGSYDLKQNTFDREHIIPNWISREDPVGYSQVWSLKVDDSSSRRQQQRGDGQGGDVWFTDAKQNAIWKFIKSSQSFEIYKIPNNSSSFVTTYPISLEIDPKNNRIFFVGTFSASLWIGDITKMKNGTSDGISQIPIPINGFNGIDPVLITTGSIALDSKNNSVWISVLSYGRKGEIFRYDLTTKSFEIFDLPAELNSPLGMAVDSNSDLWITNAGTSIFYKLNTDSGDIIKFVTSKASARVFGGDNGDQVHGGIDSNISKNAYTLPYWIQEASDGSLWFNEQEGNRIARFDPSNMKLTEYWIPTQNRLWGNCPPSNNTNANGSQKCGIANALQFSITNNNKQIWFTEWSENKIGKLDTRSHLPFSVTTTPQKELTIKRGESKQIKIKITELSSSSATKSSLHMMASGTLTPTGDLGNSTGSFSQEAFSTTVDGKSKQVTFTFKPSMNLNPGKYVLMIGAEDEAVTSLRAIEVNLS
jgi:virginiamycin B lyase